MDRYEDTKNKLDDLHNRAENYNEQQYGNYFQPRRPVQQMPQLPPMPNTPIPEYYRRSTPEPRPLDIYRQIKKVHLDVDKKLKVIAGILVVHFLITLGMVAGYI